jgi:hypothetical protein
MNSRVTLLIRSLILGNKQGGVRRIFMGAVRDFVAALIKSGPENMANAIKAIERLPSEATLNRGIDEIDKLIPYLPSLTGLAQVLTPQNIASLQKLSQSIPDKTTFDNLMKLLPYLDKLPDKETLTKLLEKADTLTNLLANM